MNFTKSHYVQSEIGMELLILKEQQVEVYTLSTNYILEKS